MHPDKVEKIEKGGQSVVVAGAVSTGSQGVRRRLDFDSIAIDKKKTHSAIGDSKDIGGANGGVTSGVRSKQQS